MRFEDGLVPIALRVDVTVWVGRLPPDLTVAEAQKIGRVVLALAEAGLRPTDGPHSDGGDEA